MIDTHSKYDMKIEIIKNHPICIIKEISSVKCGDKKNEDENIIQEI